MTQPLFLDTLPAQRAMEKTSGILAPLGDNVQMWPQEILGEAYKQLPFLSEFQVDIAVDRMEEESGFAFGSIVVKPNSQMTPGEEKEVPLETVHIPFVVREHNLAPLDLFLTGGKYKHLTEGRLRQTLYRPDIFDAARDRPYEPSMYTNLQPPLESSTGLGGVKTGSDKTAGIEALKGLLGMAKRAPSYVPVEAIRSGMNPVHDVSSMAKGLLSAKPAAPVGRAVSAGSKAPTTALRSASGVRGVKLAQVLPILPQLHGQVHDDHVRRLEVAMEKDANFRASYLNAKPGVRAAVDSALHLEPSDPEKTAEEAWARVPPTVVQLQKLANGNYLVKWANAEMYAPQQQEVPPSVAQEMVGDLDLRQRLESDGSVTASPDAAVKQTLEADEVRAIDQFGLWVVQESSGTDLVGWAFPQVLSLDMQPLPLVIFSNGLQYAAQARIAGKLVGKSTDIPKGLPRGRGCFYYLDHGTAKAFVPMTILNSMRNESGLVSYRAQLITGEEATISIAEGLKTVAPAGPGEYVVPADFCWLPLRVETELVPEPMLFSKVATAVSHGEIISDGSVYSFRGPAFAKLASSQHQFLNRLDAEFLGVCAGLHENFIKQALDKTHRGAVVKLSGLTVMGGPFDKISAAREKVAAESKKLDIKNYFLVKEALYLDDAMTADKILGLGFLNAENVQTFVAMLPALEATSSQLSELLMATRIGLRDVPEEAVERMLVALEDVIQGLYRLKQREVSFQEQPLS